MSRLDEEFKFYGVTLKDLVAKGWACRAAAGSLSVLCRAAATLGRPELWLMLRGCQ